MNRNINKNILGNIFFSAKSKGIGSFDFPLNLDSLELNPIPLMNTVHPVNAHTTPSQNQKYTYKNSYNLPEDIHNIISNVSTQFPQLKMFFEDASNCLGLPDPHLIQHNFNHSINDPCTSKESHINDLPDLHTLHSIISSIKTQSSGLSCEYIVPIYAYIASFLQDNEHIYLGSYNVTQNTHNDSSLNLTPKSFHFYSLFQHLFHCTIDTQYSEIPLTSTVTGSTSNSRKQHQYTYLPTMAVDLSNLLFTKLEKQVDSYLISQFDLDIPSNSLTHDSKSLTLKLLFSSIFPGSIYHHTSNSISFLKELSKTQRYPEFLVIPDYDTSILVYLYNIYLKDMIQTEYQLFSSISRHIIPKNETLSRIFWHSVKTKNFVVGYNTFKSLRVRVIHDHHNSKGITDDQHGQDLNSMYTTDRFGKEYLYSLYHTMLSLAIQQYHPEIAFRLLQTMKSDNLPFTIVTFNTILKSCLDSENSLYPINIQTLFSIFPILFSLKIPPNELTFAYFAEICRKGGYLTKASQTLQTLLENPSVWMSNNPLLKKPSRNKKARGSRTMSIATNSTIPNYFRDDTIPTPKGQISFPTTKAILNLALDKLDANQMIQILNSSKQNLPLVVYLNTFVTLLQNTNQGTHINFKTDTNHNTTRGSGNVIDADQCTDIFLNFTRIASARLPKAFSISGPNAFYFRWYLSHHAATIHNPGFIIDHILFPLIHDIQDALQTLSQNPENVNFESSDISNLPKESFERIHSVVNPLFRQQGVQNIKVKEDLIFSMTNKNPHVFIHLFGDSVRSLFGDGDGTGTFDSFFDDGSCPTITAHMPLNKPIHQHMKLTPFLLQSDPYNAIRVLNGAFGQLSDLEKLYAQFILISSTIIHSIYQTDITRSIPQEYLPNSSFLTERFVDFNLSNTKTKFDNFDSVFADLSDSSKYSLLYPHFTTIASELYSLLHCTHGSLAMLWILGTDEHIDVYLKQMEIDRQKRLQMKAARTYTGTFFSNFVWEIKDNFHNFHNLNSFKL